MGRAERHRGGDGGVPSELLDVPPQEDAPQAVGHDVDAAGAGQLADLLHPPGQARGEGGNAGAEREVVEAVHAREPVSAEMAIQRPPAGLVVAVTVDQQHGRVVGHPPARPAGGGGPVGEAERIVQRAPDRGRRLAGDVSGHGDR
ncbi:MAG: hypothetical protein NVS1B12_15170 [Acidimicrobiales bacterium]